jgi:hypothetical protein
MSLKYAVLLLVLLIGAPVYAQFPITSRCEVVEITGSGDDRKAEFVCAKAKGLVSPQFLQPDGSAILVMPLRDLPWSDMERESGPLGVGSRVVIQRKSKDDWLTWRLERCGTEGPNGLKVDCGDKVSGGS